MLLPPIKQLTSGGLFEFFGVLWLHRPRSECFNDGMNGKFQVFFSSLSPCLLFTTSIDTGNLIYPKLFPFNHLIMWNLIEH